MEVISILSMSFITGHKSNKKNTIFWGPLPVNSSIQKDFRECFDCPDLSINCIKEIYDVTIEDLKENNYQIIYLVSGKILLSSPYSNQIEKNLRENELILISNKSKVMIESSDGLPARFVVKDLAGKNLKSACNQISKCPNKYK